MLKIVADYFQYIKWKVNSSALYCGILYCSALYSMLIVNLEHSIQSTQ